MLRPLVCAGTLLHKLGLLRTGYCCGCIWLQCHCCLSCCCCRQLAHAAALLTAGAACLLPQNRMNKLESLRLEVDSRRRTVGKLGKKVGCCCCACR